MSQRRSIATQTSIKMGVLLAVTVIVMTLVTFQHISSTARTLVEGQLTQYIFERGLRESEYIKQAEEQLLKLVDSYYQERDTYQTVTQQRFYELLESRSDQTWRSPWMSFDQYRMAGLFVSQGTDLNVPVQRRVVQFSDLVTRIGGALTHNFPNLYVVGAENYMAMYWPEQLWAEAIPFNANLLGEPFYMRSNAMLHKERKVFWTPVYYNQILKRWVVSSVAPLVYFGEQVGTAGKDMPIQDLLARVSQKPLLGGYNLIARRDGQLIAHPNMQASLPGDEHVFAPEQLQMASQQELADLPQLLESWPEGKTAVVEDEANGRLIAISHIGPTDWFYITIYPKSIIDGTALAAARGVLLVGVVALVLQLLIISWLMRTRIARPLQQLIQEIKHFSAGREIRPLKIYRRDELGQLGESYNQMQQRIQHHVKELDEEIEARTVAQAALEEMQNSLEETVELRTQELMQANEALNTSLDELHTAQSQLVESEKMAALGGLVAGVAHEINTPVGVAVTATSVLKDSQQALQKRFENNQMSRKDLEEFLHQIDETTHMLAHNLNRAVGLVKSFKQVAVDQSSETLREFEVVQYVNEVLISLHPQLKKTAHRINVQADEAIMMFSYPGALAQVLTNLIMNSLEHGFTDKAQGQIEITLKQKDAHLLLDYTDDGVGMSDTELEQLFQPFYTTRRGQGFQGLGTSVIYNVVTHKLAGKVACDSQPGQGLSYHFTIPLQCED